MSKPVKFAHIVYRTRHFEQMLQWYQTVFEARIQYRNPALAFLTYDDEHHRMAFVNLDAFDAAGDDPLHPSRATVEHVAYTYASLTDLMDNFLRLKACNIEPYWAIHHGVTISLYYGDPDGNQMEFQVDCFTDSDKANAYMHGESFSANPLGVEFDPQEVADRIAAGIDPDEFMKRPPGPISPVRSVLRPR